MFFEDENELVVKLENTIPGVGKAPHNRGTAGGVGCGDLLPDHRAHIVEPDGLAKFDDLRPDGNDLVPAVIDRAGKLVADVDAETAAGMQHPFAFVPDKVQVVDVALVTLVKADLVLRPLVLELPVGW